MDSTLYENQRACQTVLIYLQSKITLSGGCQDTDTEEGDRGSHRTWSGGEEGTKHDIIYQSFNHQTPTQRTRIR